MCVCFKYLPTCNSNEIIIYSCLLCITSDYIIMIVYKMFANFCARTHTSPPAHSSHNLARYRAVGQHQCNDAVAVHHVMQRIRPTADTVYNILLFFFFIDCNNDFFYNNTRHMLLADISPILS